MTGDYPEGRGRTKIEAAGLEIEGVSIAGHESFYKVPAFRTLLEFGRAPDDTVGYDRVCVSHGHLDHAAGIAHHASRRRLAGLPPATVYVPLETLEEFRAFLQAAERLERIDYGVRLEPARPGDRHRLRADLELTVLPGRHRVPTVAYLFSEVRQKLREEHAGKSGEEIAALRHRGESVTRREEIPLLAYTGDCGREIFEAAPEILRARVLLIECSFLLADDVDRARKYEHIHLEDILEHADRFENEAIVLTHFSQRYRTEEIRGALSSLPTALAGRVTAFLPRAASPPKAP
jgi:ribonuclease Z